MAKSKHDVADSGRQHLGSVYAKALLGAAEKAGQSQQVLDELDSLVSDVLNKLPQLDAAFASPRITAEEKSAMIDKAFGGRMSVTLQHFLKVVAKHERLDCLRAVKVEAQKLQQALRGQVEVTVHSAATLDQAATNAVGRAVPFTDAHVHCGAEICGGTAAQHVRIDTACPNGLCCKRIGKRYIRWGFRFGRRECSGRGICGC